MELILLLADSSKNAAGALSTNPVDKIVDFLWAVHPSGHESRRKSAAIKISAVLSNAETKPYEIESDSVGDSIAAACSFVAAVH